jgi:hypothetical protein
VGLHVDTSVVRTYYIYLINQSPYVRTIYLHSNICTGSGSGSGSGQFQGAFPELSVPTKFFGGEQALLFGARHSNIASNIASNFATRRALISNLVLPLSCPAIMWTFRTFFASGNYVDSFLYLIPT